MGRSDQTISRTDSLRLKLSSEMVSRLDRIAVSHGMPASTVAAYGLASWINQQEMNAQLGRMAALEIARSLKDQLGDLDAMLEKAMPGMIAVANQVQASMQSEGGEVVSHQ